MPLTAIILTHNSEKTLNKCLEGLIFCDELIVVDDISTDSTVSIAQKYTPKVFQHGLVGDFAAQRNWAMDQAKNDWILFVDSDEVVSPELQNEIKNLQLQNNTNITSYRIKRIDMFMGQRVSHGDVTAAATKGIIRLVKAGTGSWKGKVHEEWHQLESTEKHAGDGGQLQNHLIHFPHPTIAEFLQEVNTYSSLRAKELFAAKQTASGLDLITYPFGKFFYTYFFQMGFLDGPAGFIYSFMMSFHSFLVRAKLVQYYLDAQPTPATPNK